MTISRTIAASTCKAYLDIFNIEVIPPSCQMVVDEATILPTAQLSVDTLLFTQVIWEVEVGFTGNSLGGGYFKTIWTLSDKAFVMCVFNSNKQFG